ncbi:unnamed protein product [Brassica oleracea]
MYKINGTANINAIRAASEKGVKRFVYISAADFGLAKYLLSGYYEGKPLLCQGTTNLTKVMSVKGLRMPVDLSCGQARNYRIIIFCFSCFSKHTVLIDVSVCVYCIH